MSSIQGFLQGIFAAGPELGVVFKLEKTVFAQPGQYFQLLPDLKTTFLPATLWPIETSGSQLKAIAENAPAWNIGAEVHLRGPFGLGFRLPPSVTRVALVPFGRGRALGLLPLARELLAQHKEVTLVSETPPANLPPSIEVLPPEQIDEAKAWADALALACAVDEIAELKLWLGERKIRQAAQVLIQSEMPCTGLANCGICAVKTKTGWKLACKEGPVFELEELGEE
jgi:dihydroorotate dehydrogenase electron transfer subunit